MLPREEKVLKTFILENESTQHSQVIILPITISSKEIDLSELINKNIQNYQSSLFRIYDFNTNQYKKIEEFRRRGSKEYHVPSEYVNNGQAVVLIKYRGVKENSACSSSRQESFSESADDMREVISDTSSLKKERAKERAISEVIEIVKRWRELHLQKRGDKKISLQEAAKLVGLPKKSLDDYYYQLRLGEKYDFDFKSHLYEGIGCLRNFLKDKKPRLKSEHSEKRPKNLKIIDEFDEMRVGLRNMAMEVEEEEGDFGEVEKRESEKGKKVHFRNNNNNNSNNNNNNNNKKSSTNKKEEEQKEKEPLFFEEPYYNNDNNYDNNYNNNNNNYDNTYNYNNEMKQIIDNNEEEEEQKYSKMFEEENDDSIEMKLENQFYEDFGFMESYQDPFINLDANFKKKKFENMFDEELFF